MDSSPNNSVVLRTSQSSSDLSYSSGASSVPSTRDTSPDSARLLQDSTNLPEDSARAGEVPAWTPEVVKETDVGDFEKKKALDMDRNPFSSVNDRRSKFDIRGVSVSHPGAGAAGQKRTNMGRNMAIHPQLTPPPANSTTSITSAYLHPRAVTSANWRTASHSDLSVFPPSSSPTSTAVAASSQTTNFCNHTHTHTHTHTQNNHQNNPCSSHNHNLPSPITPSGLHSSNKLIHLAPPAANANVFEHFPGLTIIMDGQMDHTYGYCYDRGNGQFTRLIPVDMLPPLREIAARQTDATGMIILPVPTMAAPNGMPSNSEQDRLNFMTPPNSPTTSTDPIQSRIDSIVAAFPPPNCSSAMINNMGGMGMGGSSSMNSLGSSMGSSSNNKKIKIYCDKWIHDGTCAFTQQGCKYKHEMPNDKETQEKLGLFHGYPAWWKKMQAERQRPIGELCDSPVALSSSGSAGGGLHGGRGGSSGSGGGSQVFVPAWRRNDAVGVSASSSSSSGVGQQQQVDSGAGTSGGSFGAVVSGGRGDFGRHRPPSQGHSRVFTKFPSTQSPYGPIAPPPKVDHHESSKSDLSSSYKTVPSNPYTVLQSLESQQDTKAEESEHEEEEPQRGAKLN